MRKLAAALLALLLSLTPLALAESALLIVTTDLSAQGAMLMDDNGQSLSTLVAENRRDDAVDWTLRITNSGASKATLYT